MTTRFQRPKWLAAAALLLGGGCADATDGNDHDEPALSQEEAPGCEATPATTTPPEAARSVCDELTYANTGAPFFSKYCAVCHRLPQPTFNTLGDVTNFRNRITTRLFQMPSAPMPPPNAPLQPPADEKSKLRQWLACTPLD